MKAKSTNSLAKQMALYALGTTVILMIPLLAMQFTNEVDWGTGDFIVIGALLLGAGFVFEVIKRNVDKKYRVYIALAIIAAVLLIWVHLAVGIVNDWPLAGS